MTRSSSDGWNDALSRSWNASPDKATVVPPTSDNLIHPSDSDRAKFLAASVRRAIVEDTRFTPALAGITPDVLAVITVLAAEGIATTLHAIRYRDEPDCWDFLVSLSPYTLPAGQTASLLPSFQKAELG
jgi:hypothetical protein